MWLRFIKALPLRLMLRSPRILREEYSADSWEQIRQNLDAGKALLVDVRETDEWRREHVVEAVGMPLTELGELAKRQAPASDLGARLPRDKILYCHCLRGGRALLAAELLRKLGHECRPLKAGPKELAAGGFTLAESAEASPE